MTEPPALDDWAPWQPGELAQRLRPFRQPWWIAGGWAIDLFLGEQTREHADIEFGVAREQFAAIRSLLDGLSFCGADDGAVYPLPPGSPPADRFRQIWGYEPGLCSWRTDIFLEDVDGPLWRSHRDPRVALPVEQVYARTPEGIPFLRPELALFYKAKHRRPKDEADFAAAAPRLDDVARARLIGWLRLVHDGHEWLERLA
ncbi:hypothetical protein AB0H43_22415 [Hamadaea sp. NPDC050747]|uniref:nucleotidyltransferase domain-containing protein n=1 Tax=Hamadaea sp. NPDC050747 TaxID=3155789 RepID=UPI0033D8C1D0